MSERMNFEQTVEALRDPARPPHFLAMDQSAGTHEKHMKQFGVTIESPEDFQRKAAAVRQMLATTPELGKTFGGAIVHDDLFTLTDNEGRPLQDRLRGNGVLVIGKKMGLNKETGLATELDTLCAGMRELVEQWNVHMIKTRTTVTHGKGHAADAADQMVQVQRAAAKNGEMMAILEPEFIKDNTGSLRDNEDLMAQVLGRIVSSIEQEGLSGHPYAIKTSFPAPGKLSGEEINPEKSAEAWMRICERAEIPEELLVVFLSGGHSPENSRMMLQAIAKRMKGTRYRVGSSFSRANLEGPYRRTFSGGNIDIPAGHKAVDLEGRKNAAALQGFYHPGMEKVTADGV
ncbi:MAG: fructose-bisphosphate aldolase [Candidatus Peribacteraceae bacterium]|nr:fructose-bisphosphate aldolase [Candidatus Peribacteraceae bacterium]MDD5074655.1 fructose-bisphosphate aldolase [Candidatus Peribacteraceae bacterium]